MKQGVSDIHIVVGQPPVFRLHGRMRKLETKVLEAEDTVSLMKSITPERCQRELQEAGVVGERSAGAEDLAPDGGELIGVDVVSADIAVDDVLQPSVAELDDDEIDDVREAAITRLRPVMMTMLSTVLGDLTRDPGETVGDYDILQGALGLTTANYVLAFNQNILTITAAPQQPVTNNVFATNYVSFDPLRSPSTWRWRHRLSTAFGRS